MPDHPVCGAKVGFAAFFLMPQPPLLYQEGSLANGCVKYIDALSKEYPELSCWPAQ